MPAPKPYHKPPIIIYQGVRPPVHVYEKPQAQAPQQSYGASSRVETYKAPPKAQAQPVRKPTPSYPSVSPPAKTQYSTGANRYKATKKSDSGKEHYRRYQQHQQNRESGKYRFTGLNNIFSGAVPPSSEPRAKLEEIQAPDLSPSGSNINQVYSAPVAQARIDTDDRDKDRSAVVRAVVSVSDTKGNLIRRGTVTDITHEQ